VSATSVALSATLVSAAVISSRRSVGLGDAGQRQQDGHRRRRGQAGGQPAGQHRAGDVGQPADRDRRWQLGAGEGTVARSTAAGLPG
jgi:hypothetical protein